MNKDQILKSDILDIVFEKRNKAYGAYTLRKLYPGRLKLALGLMFIFALLLSAIAFLTENKNEILERVYNNEEIKFREIDINPSEPVKKPELPKPTIAAKLPVNQKQLTSNVAIVDDNVKTDVVNTILPTDAIGTKTITNASTGLQIPEPVKPAPGNGVSENTVLKVDPTVPLELDAVEIKPGFPGGIDALLKFLKKNLSNPYDFENGETISVLVRFVVGYDGKLKSFVVVKDGGEAFNKEVIRVLKKMPDWIPGKSKGENVSVYYTIPVKFVMSN